MSETLTSESVGLRLESYFFIGVMGFNQRLHGTRGHKVPAPPDPTQTPQPIANQPLRLPLLSTPQWNPQCPSRLGCCWLGPPEEDKGRIKPLSSLQHCLFLSFIEPSSRNLSQKRQKCIANLGFFSIATAAYIIYVVDTCLM